MKLRVARATIAQTPGWMEGKVVLEEVAGCHCYVAGPETVVVGSEEGVRADWSSPPAATFFGGFEFSLHKLLQLPLAGWWKEEEAPQHPFSELCTGRRQIIGRRLWVSSVLWLQVGRGWSGGLRRDGGWCGGLWSGGGLHGRTGGGVLGVGG